MKNTITPEEHARIKRRRWRQTLGLLITVLVLIGFITVLRAGVGLVANLFDDTAQKQEYEDMQNESLKEPRLSALTEKMYISIVLLLRFPRNRRLAVRLLRPCTE